MLCNVSYMGGQGGGAGCRTGGHVARSMQVAAAGFEEGELRLALQLHYLEAESAGAASLDAGDGVVVATAFLQRAGAPSTPSLADLERAAQAVNLHLEAPPFSRAVALENDLFVTPFGAPPRADLAPLDDVAACDAAAADAFTLFAAVPRAALPWHMAPTLPILPSSLRVSRATPPGGAVNTFVTLRGRPPRGVRVVCAGAAVCLVVTGALHLATRRRLVGHAHAIAHAFWLSAAVAGLAAVVATFDCLAAPEQQWTEDGVELWGCERWRVRSAARLVPGQLYKWRCAAGGGWWQERAGAMSGLQGAKVSAPVRRTRLTLQIQAMPQHDAAAG